jgi:hypothetical protein
MVPFDFIKRNALTLCVKVLAEYRDIRILDADSTKGDYIVGWKMLKLGCFM